MKSIAIIIIGAIATTVMAVEPQSHTRDMAMPYINTTYSPVPIMDLSSPDVIADENGIIYQGSCSWWWPELLETWA
jgi:hypothetical protein